MGTSDRATRIDPVLHIAEDRAPQPISFDNFERQQQLLLDAQARQLDILNTQTEKVMKMTSAAAEQVQAMLNLQLQVAADLTGAAVAAARDAQERARQAEEKANQAQGEASKVTMASILDAVAQLLKEKGFTQ